MALTDEQQASLEKQLAEKDTQLKSLLEKTKLDENAAKEAEAKRSKEKAGEVKLDPDVVKEVAQLKQEMADIKKQLNTGSVGGGYSRLNFFKEG